MSIDNFFQKGVNQNETFQPAEKLEGVKKQIWEKASRILSSLGLDFSSQYGGEKGEEIVRRIDEIEQLSEEKECDNPDDNLFIECELDYQGSPAIFKMVGQDYPGYKPDYKIDYAVEDPDFQKEAERRLMREAVTVEKLSKFGGEKISADTIEKSETTPGSDMYFVKKSQATEKNIEDFGFDEGKQLTATLLELQYVVDSSGLIKEVMAERQYSNQYELENEFSEDIFNDFDGYLDKAQAVMGDRVAEKVITKKQVKMVLVEMKKFRAIIESRQMKDHEYSLVFNNTSLDNLQVDANGNIRLSDWSKIGTTQNRELSMVCDLGLALESAREHADDSAQFEQGVEEGLKEYYAKFSGLDSQKAEEIATAVLRLAKLMFFQEL